MHNLLVNHSSVLDFYRYMTKDQRHVAKYEIWHGKHDTAYKTCLSWKFKLIYVFLNEDSEKISTCLSLRGDAVFDTENRSDKIEGLI